MANSYLTGTFTLQVLTSFLVALTPPTKGSTTTLKKSAPAISTVLSAVCYAGNTAPDAAQLHLKQQLPHLVLNIESGANTNFKTLDLALNELEGLKPLEKPVLLKAIAMCIQLDGNITPAEAELMRAVADSINCPMPLL